MKHVYLLLSALTGFFFSQNVIAQCTPITTYTQPGLYPDTMPEGSVGVPYAEDVSFVLPTDTLGYNFTNFQIASISLPAGLVWICNNNANGCNYDPQTNIYGCVNVSGTPLLAGDYTIQVSVIADLTISNGNVFAFEVFLRINPATVNTSNNGFALTASSNCSPVTVNIVNNNPGLAHYDWNFGNGNTSTAENPSTQLYNAPGQYIINYAAFSNYTSSNVYTLSNFTINSMSNFGESFPAYETADAYVKILDGATVVYIAPVVTNQNAPISWSPGTILNSSIAYTIEVWESDAADPLFGADDFIGTAPLNILGCSGCAIANGVISYTVNNQLISPTPSIVSIDTIQVYGIPAIPLISYNAPTQILSTTSPAPQLQWYFNNVSIPGANASTYSPTQSGYYKLLAFNGGGCNAESDSLLVVICDTTIVPLIVPFGATSLTVSNPDSYPLQWFLNGNAIAGEVFNILNISQGGNYSVTFTNSFGCLYASDVLVSNLSIAENETINFKIYPNPTEGLINIDFNASEGISELQILDITGRVIYAKTVYPNEKFQINLNEFASSMVFISITRNNTNFVERVILK